MEQLQSPLVVFGPDHIDTSRAELLVQRLSKRIFQLKYICSDYLFGISR